MICPPAMLNQGGAVVKNPPDNAGDARDLGLIPESGGSPGVGNGNPLQHSCLENPMDRGAWWATVQGGLKESGRAEWLSTRNAQPNHQYSPGPQHSACLIVRA